MKNQDSFQLDFYIRENASPIEEMIGEQLGKYANFDNCNIETQYEIDSSGGKFFLDFLIKVNERKYALECHGKDYHEYYSDLYRDAWLLGEKHIDEMIRFKGCDIVSCINLCMLYLYRAIPNLFSERYEHVFDQKARSERWEIMRDSDPDGEHFNDDIIWLESDCFQEECIIRDFHTKINHRYNNENNGNTKKTEWWKAFSYIIQNGIRTKEEFVDKYPKRFNSLVSNPDDI